MSKNHDTELYTLLSEPNSFEIEQVKEHQTFRQKGDANRDPERIIIEAVQLP